MDYDNYVAWKNWQWADPQSLPQWKRDTFDKELEACAGRPGTLLEVGFGAGDFLVHATSRGWKVKGIEVIPELVALATQAGYDVVLVDLTKDSVDSWNDTFDLVVLLDVIEHLDVAQCQNMMLNIHRMLRPGGLVLCRFPNGNSPFSMPYYNGDHTHKTWHTESSLQQMLIGTGLSLKSYRNAARVAARPLKPLKSILFAVRSIIEMILGLVYHGRRIPMDPNAVAVLARD